MLGAALTVSRLGSAKRHWFGAAVFVRNMCACAGRLVWSSAPLDYCSFLFPVHLGVVSVGICGKPPGCGSPFSWIGASRILCGDDSCLPSRAGFPTVAGTVLVCEVSVCCVVGGNPRAI